MKLLKGLFFTIGLATLLAACGDDSGSSGSEVNGYSENEPIGNEVNEDNEASENHDKAVPTLKELGVCDVDSRGEVVYVEMAEVNYRCNGKTWKIYEDDETSNDDKPTSSSVAKSARSSDSKDSSDGKGSSNSKDGSSSVIPGSDRGSSSSNGKDESGSKNSSNSKISSSSVIPGSSSSVIPGSDRGSSSSNGKAQVSEIAATKKDLSECTPENAGAFALVQSDMTYYRCDGTEYVEVDEDDLISSSGSAGGSDSETGSSDSGSTPEESSDSEPALEISSSSMTEEELDIQKNTEGLVCKRDSLYTGVVDVDHFYYCYSYSDGSALWRRATDAEVETFGEDCEEGVLYKGKIHEDKIFSCTSDNGENRHGKWHEATEMDFNTVGEECLYDGKLIHGAVDTDVIFACRFDWENEFTYWEIASARDLDINSRECSFKTLDAMVQGVNTGDNYVCRQNLSIGCLWYLATNADMDTQGEKCENNRIIKGVLNPDKYYICLESVAPEYDSEKVRHWVELTRTEANTYNMHCENKIVKGKMDEDIEYSCTGNVWHEATEVDYDVADKTCYSTIAQNGNINKDVFYICEDDEWRYATKIERNVSVSIDGKTHMLDWTNEVHKGIIDTNDYFVYELKKWREADLFEVRRMQGIEGCSEDEEGAVIREEGFAPVYCEDGELSFYIEAPEDFDSWYHFDYMDDTKSYVFVKPYENTWLKITCGGYTKRLLIGTIDGENYYNGEEIKPMPEKVKFKVDNGYYNCDVRLESYVLLE